MFTYVQRHEFEGLLFSEVDAFADLLDLSASSMTSLYGIRAEFETPEDIDDGPDTAPSKRIMRLVPGYRKRTYGPLIAEKVGLETMRTECPRFHWWLHRLESVGDI